VNDEFRVGAASVDISPDRPELLIPGNLHVTRPAIGVLEGNRLYADTIALSVGGRAAVIATCDTIFSGLRADEELCQSLAEKAGCREALVIVAGRHNHSSRSTPVDRDNADAVEANRQYRQKVHDGIVDACVRAAADLKPAEIAAGTATLKEPVGQNRRMRYGHGGAMPSWGTGPIAVPGEKMAGPAGPDSTRIDFLCARQPGHDRPFAILTSYASHIHLVGIPYFNGESVGGFKRAVQERIPGVTLAYANSTGGDLDMHCVHPVPAGGMDEVLEWYRRSTELLGQRFADALVPALPRDGFFRPTEIRSLPASGDAAAGGERRYTTEAVALGEVALVGIPGELFVEFGYEMHRRSPFKHLLLLGYAGGVGYAGTPLAYEQGGYETGRTPSPARSGIGPAIVQEVYDLLQRLAG
jgi:neutral ceramidase